MANALVINQDATTTTKRGWDEVQELKLNIIYHMCCRPHWGQGRGILTQLKSLFKPLWIHGLDHTERAVELK